MTPSTCNRLYLALGWLMIGVEVATVVIGLL